MGIVGKVLLCSVVAAVMLVTGVLYCCFIVSGREADCERRRLRKK